MNRKVLALLIILMAVCTISVVSASETKTIAGVEFEIPGGFSYDADATNTFLNSMQNKSAEDIGVLKNSNNEPIIIMVYNKTPEEQVLPDEYKQVNKTIDGKNGTFMSAPSRANIGFQYADGDKFIVIQAPNEDLLDDVIK